MPETHFDQYSSVYKKQVSSDVKLFGEGYEYFARYKIEILKRFYRDGLGSGAVQTPLRILEIGCGTGGIQPFLPLLERNYLSLGLDYSFQSVKEAARANPGGRYFQGTAAALPLGGGNFDLVFLAVVIHHFPMAIRPSVFAEAARVLKPGGVAAVFEHNPYNPLTRWVVGRSPLDRDAILLPLPEVVRHFEAAGLQVRRKQYTTFFPKALRPLRAFEHKIGWCFLGGQYFVGAVKPAA